MNLMLLRVFQRHVHEQCVAVLISNTHINPNTPYLWYGIQNLLTASANISKAFWGQNAQVAQQREPLRASLNVPDSSPLKQRKMRNNFEHIDQRLDEWDTKSLTHNYIEHTGPPSDVLQGIETHPHDYFRGYDPQTGLVHFWGDTFDILAIVAEAERIRPIAAAEMIKPHWTS